MRSENWNEKNAVGNWPNFYPLRANFDYIFIKWIMARRWMDLYYLGADTWSGAFGFLFLVAATLTKAPSFHCLDSYDTRKCYSSCVFPLQFNGERVFAVVGDGRWEWNLRTQFFS